MSKLGDYLPIPQGYGRAIPIMISETISSFLKDRRFYISILYYILFPIILVLSSAGSEVIETGTGIAIYYAQLNTSVYIKTLFLTFFPGQIFLVILSSDQIAGEIENDSLPLLLSKPMYHSEVVLGKFFGLLSILAFLQIPSLAFIYYFNLIRYQAEFPFAFYTSFDEVIAMLLLVLLLQSMILALALLISSIFDRSLYAILTSILSLFALSSISDAINANPNREINYVSLVYYVDAFLPHIFFNLEKIDPLPNLFSLSIVMIGFLFIFLVGSILTLRYRELF